MPDLPWFIPFVFIATTLLTVYLFFRASRYSIPVILLLLAWLGIQAAVSLQGFYHSNTGSWPPRFLLLVAPALLLILIMFISKKGKVFTDKLDLRWLTWLHIIRIPVELVLLWLYRQGTVPELMTFEGRNLDIISGITAPIMALYCFRVKGARRSLLLGWNLACLALLLNIVINAILSAPSAFQQFAFDQPNIAVLYFPFVWLPCCIVPIVFYSHLAAIRQLLRQPRT